MTEIKNNPLEIVEFIDIGIFQTEIAEDMNDLNEAMRKLPERAAYYATLAAKARTQSMKIDNIVKSQEAKYKVEHRRLLTEAAIELAEQEGGKPERITTDMVNSAVYSDPRMLKLMDIQLHAEEVKMVCNVAAEAFRTRRDMLKSMGHLAIEEMRKAVRVQRPSDAIDEYRARRAARGGGENPGA